MKVCSSYLRIVSVLAVVASMLAMIVIKKQDFNFQKLFSDTMAMSLKKYPPFQPSVERNTSKHKWTNILKGKYEIIANEFEHFKTDHIESYTKLQLHKMYPQNHGTAYGDSINEESKWSVVTLRCYGTETDLSREYFPETMKLIKRGDQITYLPHVIYTQAKCRGKRDIFLAADQYFRDMTYLILILCIDCVC